MTRRIESPGVRILLLMVAFTALSGAPRGRAADPEPNPADLRLEWLNGGVATRADAEPLRGRRGETLTVPYRLRNVGGRDAFAAVLEAWTALGRSAPPERLQPGPEAGGATDRTLRLAVAEGMRELCLDARLQTLDADEPGDPNPRDNRICREVEVEKNAFRSR